jgi:hypothetical protein
LENGRSRSAIIVSYVTGFVEPATGRTVWNIANAVCKELFELILVDFARSVGAGDDKRIVLQLDNAGWHGPENLAVPDGIRLVFQPAHSPELQPAEHLWRFVDEPLAVAVSTPFTVRDAKVTILNHLAVPVRRDNRDHLIMCHAHSVLPRPQYPRLCLELLRQLSCDHCPHLEGCDLLRECVEPSGCAPV